MRKTISILGTTFFLVTICLAAHADIVPGAVFYLDARDNPTHPDAWTNLAEDGGSIPPMALKPALEEGPIKIPDIGFNERKTKYYTSRKSAEMYGTQAWNPPLSLDDWTIEFLVRRNGDLFREEHQLLGINTLPEGRQGFRLGIRGGDTLGIGIYHGNADMGIASNVRLEEGVWNWVALTGEDKKEILVYQNGKRVSQQAGVDFDKKIPLRVITIGSFSPGEKNRNFNGSFALIRVYDKALSQNELEQNINAWSGLAVQPDSKLAITWGMLKASR
ncbi:MAG: LamG domain-containing protein [Candidatus Poribacteria bacterium]|nr:LamG domain-containing protein [Candidatus Poribacteria bacterium]MDE0503007.1 LamG domain-containing protein [Candidatus Poribacteria bacterium]